MFKRAQHWRSGNFVLFDPELGGLENDVVETDVVVLTELARDVVTAQALLASARTTSTQPRKGG